MWVEDDSSAGAICFQSSIGSSCLQCGIEPQSSKVYIMYHGTSREAAENIKREGFRQSADGMFGRGVYLSRDLQKASRYPLKLKEHERVVLKVEVDVGRVIKITSQRHPLQKSWYPRYDTAWCPPNCDMVPSGLEEDCVWDPKRIKVIREIRPKTGACGVFNERY